MSIAWSLIATAIAINTITGAALVVLWVKYKDQYKS